MKKAKWYNWVGDSVWDEYCLNAWIFVLGPILLIFGSLVVLGIINALTGSTIGV